MHIVSESVLLVTRRSPALAHSRQFLPLRVGACRGWESTSLPLPLPWGGPVVSEEEDQTCGATASPWRQGGGEKSLRSFLCRIHGRTVESTQPRYPATASHDPTERWRRHHYEKVQNTETVQKIQTWSHHADQVKKLVNENRWEQLDTHNWTEGLYSEGSISLFYTQSVTKHLNHWQLKWTYTTQHCWDPLDPGSMRMSTWHNSSA